MRFNHEHGYLIVEEGTGGNHEITQIRAYEKRKGAGKALIKKYLESGWEPYHSVYAFALKDRDGARKFYESVGFTAIDMGESIYKDDGTVLMWSTYENLRERN